MDYYNEIDPYAAEWLRSLIAAGVLPAGHVDDRDIRDILPTDLAGYRHCHFFAGLGGWAYALQLAGWPEDRPVWTGSCPCQPFSAAGKGGGFADERHLWPAWFWLIVQCRPDVVFGEQVDKATDWLDLVSTDLEGEGYACGPIVLPAAGVGAPHGRHRLWFVADTVGERRARESVLLLGEKPRRLEEKGVEIAGSGRIDGPLAHPLHPGRAEWWAKSGHGSTPGGGGVGDLGDTAHVGYQRSGATRRRGSGPENDGELGSTFWSDCDWLPCRDGKFRPVESGTFPLAHGVSARVGRLRAYGNAIVPEVAAEVIRAYRAVG